eukprot:scaffold34589_cov163-Skeletonema_dohrnii-CCMP3373.AAC.3
MNLSDLISAAMTTLPNSTKLSSNKWTIRLLKFILSNKTIDGRDIATLSHASRNSNVYVMEQYNHHHTAAPASSSAIETKSTECRSKVLGKYELPY